MTEPAGSPMTEGKGNADREHPDQNGGEHGASPGRVHAVFRVMDVMSVTLDLPGQYPVVCLQEAEIPLRELTFPVGMAEGVALAHALRKVGTPRPLTHELFTTVLQRLGADLVAVRLIGRIAGTLLGELDIMGTKGREVVTCRPSDGIALALRQVVPAPILADERLLTEPGDVAPLS